MYTLGKESGLAFEGKSWAMMDTAESRVMPVSISFTRLSSQATISVAIERASGTRALRLTELWFIQISVDEVSNSASRGSSSKTSPKARMTAASTSDIPTPVPVSRVTDVIVTAGMPQGTMRSKYPRSVETLRAKPCHVTQSRAWTPIDAILRFCVQTPV